MNKVILLVEDDKAFRILLTEVLEAKQYKVIQAENGKIARDLIAIQDVDLVLSDIQMPFFNGVDLLEWVKKYKPCPVILMTGFSQLLETKKAGELGADDFLTKPFSNKELKEKIDNLLKSEAEPTIEEKPEPKIVKFCKVPIEDFISKTHTECNVYIKLGAEKYVKISHSGGKIPEDKIASFKAKGIDYLYIHQEDFARIVGFSVAVAKVVAGSKTVKDDKKIHFIKYTGEILSQQAFINDLNPEIVNNSKDFLNTAVELLTENQETFTLLNVFKDHGDDLFSHSLNTSLLSVMIAKKMGWGSSVNLFKLAFCGLFHDIGLKEIPADVIEKPRVLLTQKERQLIETHPTRGKEILESMKSAPTEASLVAYEHHENAIGQGYPRQVNFKNIHPFTKVVQVADMFCDYVSKHGGTTKIMTPQEALKYIETYRSAEVDFDAFKALVGIVKNENKEGKR